MQTVISAFDTRGGIGARGAPRIFQRADATPIREMTRLHEEQISAQPASACASARDPSATRSPSASTSASTSPTSTGHDEGARRIDARIAEGIQEPAQRSR